MGIQGLLPQLKPIQQPITLIRYDGQTLAIDGYAWLHRAAHSCAEELALGRPTSKYLEFFIKRLNMLRNRFNINPYLVFDGDAIMVKKDTELKRKQKRAENKERALALWKAGDKRQAYDYFQKCVDVTPEMAKCVIEYCQVQDIKYIVAPFEADAQMVYLEKKGLVHGIISEDSDLLIFGCRKLITKLTDHGEGIEICRDDFPRLPSKFPLSQLCPEETRAMVCLSGCDYTAGIPKIGLLTAMKLVRKHKTMDNIIKNIQREGKFVVPKEFLEEYQLASFAFQFQRVYCPENGMMTTLSEIPEELRNCQALFSCIGKVISKSEHTKVVIVDDSEVDHHLHGRIAAGELCPYNFQKILVNRERKLQLTTKSEPIIGKPLASQAGSIDTFFSKTASVSVSSTSTGVTTQMRFAIKKQEEKLIENERKIASAVERRKLFRRDTPVVAGVGMSRYFGKSQDHPTNEEKDVTSTMATPTPVEPLISPRLPDFTKASTNSNFASCSNESLGSQDEAATDIPSSLLSTEVPSSMVPTQVDMESSPYSEEDSEVLSEIEDTAEARRDEKASNKRHCNSIADLRESFSYHRAPLQDKSVNVASGNGLLRNSKGAKSHVSAVKAPSLGLNSHVGAVKAPSLGTKRPRHYVASPSSATAPRQATRTLSLSDFIYRGQ
ncbi:exodeoxyribonuclease DIN7 [Lachancea thermotolerans CBS 6340]|uniref:KLTH0E02398p n=1 Tax=Lachancea thermotolerans (strain ATCC 56472 / CBS 6340 / NRRL Y-8284) TaxID=559295 RepID=C5DH93_LACTC|nr:KLTH0E02398p [Lachancea thermotolerans CBS 6340]CAR23154.1 KLTH0E02398p [Lachancea thermotolerans CBS 6340]